MLLCVAIFVTAILLSGHVAAAEVHGDHRKAAHDDLICNGDLNKLRRFCRRSIANDGRRAMAPTWTCCDTVLIVDMYCLCREITPRLERAVSMERVAHVAEVCRRPIRSGTRCGSKFYYPLRPDTNSRIFFWCAFRNTEVSVLSNRF